MPNQIQFSPFLNPIGAPTYQQAGTGLLKSLKKVNKFVKKNNLISKGLKLAGNVTGIDGLKQAGKVADVVGYGMQTTKKKRASKAKKSKK